METYAFLPREAVTAFLMGCPQCSTNNTTLTTVDNMQQPPLSTVTTAGFRDDVRIEQWSSSSFACSTPVKREAKNIDTAESRKTPVATVADVQDKENVIADNGGQAIAAVATATKAGNKRKRTVPLKRDVRQPCAVIATAATAAAVLSSGTSTGSSTLKHSSNGSCCSTLVLSSSSSSCRTDNSGLSRSSGGWWSKWGICSNSSRLSGSMGGGSSDLSGNTQPLDLSSSPLFAAVSPSSVAIRSSSSPSVTADDFFYKRRRVRRRRVRPKRLTRSCLGHRDNRHEADDDDDDNTSASDRECSEEVVRSGYRGVVDSGVNEGLYGGGVTAGRYVNTSERVGGVETDDDDDEGPRPAKMKRNNNNNNDDVEKYYDKAMAVDMVTTTVTVMTEAVARRCCTDDNGRVTVEDAETVDAVTDGPLMIKAEIREELPESDGTEVDESDENQVSPNIVPNRCRISPIYFIYFVWLMTQHLH